MHVRPISTLTAAEIRDLATHAAERGERIKDVNPFPRRTLQRRAFTRAYVRRALELRPFAVA